MSATPQSREPSRSKASRPRVNGDLHRFFTATLPSGLVLKNLKLHQKGEARWIGFPAREWINAQGEKQYGRFIEFASPAVADKVRDLILAALDRHVQEQGR